MSTERALAGYGLFLSGIAVSYLKGFGSKSRHELPKVETTRLLKVREFRHRLWWVLASLAAVVVGLILMGP